MSQLPVNRNKCRTHATRINGTNTGSTMTMTTITTTISNSSSSCSSKNVSITTTTARTTRTTRIRRRSTNTISSILRSDRWWLLYHEKLLRNINKRNHKLNERRIIKPSAPAAVAVGAGEPAAAVIDKASSFIHFKRNSNNFINNINNNNRNLLPRKSKSMPNLSKQFNKIDINDIHNYDDYNKYNDDHYDEYKQTVATIEPKSTTTISVKKAPDGCVHYKRRCLLVTPCCNKSYKCRFCHDENENHRLKCKSVTKLICTECQTQQNVQESCRNCGIQFGKYTCLICNLFDDMDKQQYHCHKCGICRVGGRSNFFHCQTCNICLPKHLLTNGHRCIENISRSNCPICLVNIHTSRLPCYIPPCGHLIHNLCFEQLLQNGFFKCPICQMSLLDMTVLWEFLDVQQKLMTTKISTICDSKLFDIFCNDCQKASITEFHVIGLKCMQCGSYNTTANNNQHNDNNNNNNHHTSSNNNESNNICKDELTLLATDKLDST